MSNDILLNLKFQNKNTYFGCRNTEQTLQAIALTLNVSIEKTQQLLLSNPEKLTQLIQITEEKQLESFFILSLLQAHILNEHEKVNNILLYMLEPQIEQFLKTKKNKNYNLINMVKPSYNPTQDILNKFLGVKKQTAQFILEQKDFKSLIQQTSAHEDINIWATMLQFIHTKPVPTSEDKQLLLNKLLQEQKNERQKLQLIQEQQYQQNLLINKPKTLDELFDYVQSLTRKYTRSSIKVLLELNSEETAYIKQRLKDNKEKVIAQQQWNKELVHASSMPEFLNISKTEFEYWRADGRIPITSTQNFNKWGKTLTTTLHHPNDFAHITTDTIQQWRNKDIADKAAKRIQNKAATAEKSTQTRLWNAALKELPKHHITIEYDNNYLKETKCQIIVDNIKVPTFVRVIKTLKKDIFTPLSNEKTENIKKINNFFTQALDLPLFVNSTNQFIKNSIKKTLPENIGTVEKAIFYEKVRDFVAQGISHNLQNYYDQKLTQILKQTHEFIATRDIREELNIENFQDGFTLARQMKRQFTIVVGPTNSGKTFTALDALQKAKTGVYLAPLRLLAIEIYDKLNEAKIPCNLHTGEEHIIKENARHSASTVEMLDTTRKIDVAVIDEFQMLQDTQRGWAWTAAVLGVPAKNIYLVGSREMLPVVQKWLDFMGEKYSIVECERKTPLTVLNKTIDISEIEQGDALIAFSRKQVLYFSAQLKDYGYKVSTIYGALAPEVRKKQATLFSLGKTDVVVSTDAIGMGLNLPVKRVIFSTLSKFDGYEMRELYPNELQQIAGRAGRYGMHEKGEVGVFTNEKPNTLKQLLNTQLIPKQHKMFIAPTFWHVEVLSKKLQTEHISTILSVFSQKIPINNPHYEISEINSLIFLGNIVDNISKNTISLKEKFTFSCAPINNNEDELEYFKTLLKAFTKKQAIKLPHMPEWIGHKHAAFLDQAELLSKKVSLYAWLSYKFPKTYKDQELIPQYRELLSNYINNALLIRKK